MDKKTEGLLQISAAIAIVVIAFYFSSESAALEAYGYLGAFAIALVSSATIILPAPGWAVVVAMSRSLDPILLGMAAGIGSAIGELTAYVAGDGARDILNNRVKESKDISEFVGRYGSVAIFVFAAIPNPIFDIAGIVAGSLRIQWWKFLIACAAGRVLRYILLALLGNFTLGLI